MYRKLLPLTLLTACGGTKTDDTAAEGCGVNVTSLPTDGSVNAYYRGNVEFTLSGEDSTAQIETTIPGTQVRSADGLRVIWQLSAPLATNTAYDATLHYCGGDATIHFTTSALGTPLTDPQALVGTTYAVDLTQARITDPPGIGVYLAGFLTSDILIEVTAVSDIEIDMLGAIAIPKVTPPQQNFCDPSIPFDTADFSEAPYFELGPQDTNLVVAGVEVDIEDLLIGATFAADGSYFDGGVLSGTIDTRPLAVLVDKSGNPDAICAIARNFSSDCAPCASDGEPYCLTLVADQIFAEDVPGLDIYPISVNDCPGCDQPEFDPGTCE